MNTELNTEIDQMAKELRRSVNLRADIKGYHRYLRHLPIWEQMWKSAYLLERLKSEVERLQSIILNGVIDSDLVKTYDGSALDRADQYIERLEGENNQLGQERDAVKEELNFERKYWRNE